MVPAERAGLATNEQSAVAEFMRAVREKFGSRLVKAFLYGSKARGDAEEFSDIDIFLVIEGVTQEEEWDIWDMGTDIGLHGNLFLCPIVWSDADFLRNQRLPLASNVEKEGIPL